MFQLQMRSPNLKPGLALWPFRVAALIVVLISANQVPLSAQAGSPGAAVRVSVSPGAHSSASSSTLLLAGGLGPDDIKISLSANGRTYLIESSGTLEGGGQICTNPPGNLDELVCPATAINGFEVNAGSGDNRVIVGKSVPVAATLRGGPENDNLIGGGGYDKLIGGGGNDRLIARGRENFIYGGTGNDRLYGGSGKNLLNGGPGHDACFGGPGQNVYISCEVGVQSHRAPGLSLRPVPNLL
jgi:Ca2+-binding RTX toxin-like protein